MSHVRVLIAFGQGILTLFACAQTLLIESSLLPQIWLWLSISGKDSRLLRPTFATLALYALSEPLYYLFWTWLYVRLDASEHSLGVCISCMAHAPILIAFAHPDDIGHPSPSPWKNQTIKYGINVLLIQASAAQNAAWLLMLDASEIDEKLQGLHVVFGFMAMFMTTIIWIFCWWGLVDRRPSAREIWESMAKDSPLPKQLFGQAAWVILIRMACRWMLGCSPFAMAPSI